jgi:hypothetical protein
VNPENCVVTIRYIDPLSSNIEEPCDYVEEKLMSSSDVVILSDFIAAMETLHLGAFAELRKATISFVISVCLSVRPSIPPSVCTKQRDSS